MAAQDKTTFEGTFNNSSTGLFKTNTTKDIGSDDLRTLVENLTDSVPFNEDDKYTWASPQVTASGTNTYTATPSPAIAAYATGQEFKIKFTNASTGVSTLNLNGLGAKKIFINPTTQATTDHILAGQIVKLAYDAALDSASGGFLMLGSAATSGSTAAEDVTFTPAGNIAATDVQAAIEELDSEKQLLVNSATALTDASSMDLTAIKHTLTTSSATRTFTISYTGDDISIEVTLNAATSTFTFPATSLCVSEGVATGNNTCPLAGSSGDKYLIAIKKISSAYYVVCKNFGQ